MKKIISKRINKAVKHGKYSCKIWHSNKDECLPLDMIRSLLNKNNTIVLTLQGKSIYSITAMWTTCDVYNIKKGCIYWRGILGGPFHEISFEEFVDMLPTLPIISDDDVIYEGKIYNTPRFINGLLYFTSAVFNNLSLSKLNLYSKY